MVLLVGSFSNPPRYPEKEASNLSYADEAIPQIAERLSATTPTDANRDTLVLLGTVLQIAADINQKVNVALAALRNQATYVQKHESEDMPHFNERLNEFKVKVATLNDAVAALQPKA